VAALGGSLITPGGIATSACRPRIGTVERVRSLPLEGSQLWARRGGHHVAAGSLITPGGIATSARRKKPRQRTRFAHYPWRDRNLAMAPGRT